MTWDATKSTRAAVQQEEGKGERTAVTVHGNDLFANVEETVPLDRAHVKTPEAPTNFTTPENGQHRYDCRRCVAISYPLAIETSTYMGFGANITRRHNVHANNNTLGWEKKKKKGRAAQHIIHT